MAEYIDREHVIEFVRNYPHYDFDSLVEELYELPTADVIERSKIDKAIKEIKGVSFKHYFEQGEYVGEITEQWEVVKLDHVLDILKRNIGE